MQSEPLTAWVCTALMRIGTRMATGFDHHFREQGITQAQFRILLMVWSQGGRNGIPPSELAEALFIERGTVSVTSQRMVKLGWLERLPGDNRRSHRLRLTEAGGKLLERCVPRAINLANATLSSFSPRQLKDMRANLEAIEAELRATQHGGNS